MLLDGEGVVGAALDRGIVADDHAFPARDAADAGDDPGAVDGVVVEAVRGERGQLQEGRSEVEEAGDALAREQLAARNVPLAGAARAALSCGLTALAQFCGKFGPGCPVR